MSVRNGGLHDGDAAALAERCTSQARNDRSFRPVAEKQMSIDCPPAVRRRPITCRFARVTSARVRLTPIRRSACRPSSSRAAFCRGSRSDAGANAAKPRCHKVFYATIPQKGITRRVPVQFYAPLRRP